jgi:histidyl-tRNA synthetase
MTLKPEGTAGAARMFIENGMHAGVLPVKAYYIAPCFRYERPQAGRLREFHQFGIEVFGSKTPDTDAEVIFAASSFLQKLGLDKVELHINSIGCPTCRKNYNEALKNYYRPHLEELCFDCKSRFEKNPLRMLDCKEPNCKVVAAKAPVILDYLCDECKAHFSGVQTLLKAQGVKFVVDPYIVRGLDYYTKTVFEFVSTDIGAQGTVCAGGRYDGLIEGLGGVPTPAVGFAAGIERLLLLMENTGKEIPDNSAPTLYIAGMDDETRVKAFTLANSLRAKGLTVEIDHMARSIKAQLKYADKLGAKFVAVLGGDELASQTLNVKRMANGEQQKVSFNDLYTYLTKE